MAAVQIPVEFAVWVWYVTLALAALAFTPKSLYCVHDSSGQLLDEQFCNSWTVAAVWIPGWSR